ncbi:zeatin O-xylosyltransferase-like protein, partial [Tanacetum coccineum]
HKSLQWLDKHDQDSVIYVSFGTTTSLSNEQIQELAIGLEKSGQRFIWVLRDADKGDIFEGEARRVELPKGFEERLEEKGLIVREWAPQLEILAHPATGGFMSHCGWNSSMESITMGVPIAAWPMHSDQPRNATLLIDVLKIGISVWDWSNRGKLVTSSTIDTAIRNLMASGEGNEIRKRAAKLGVDVKRSVEEGGITRMEIDSFCPIAVLVVSYQTTAMLSCPATATMVVTWKRIFKKRTKRKQKTSNSKHGVERAKSKVRQSKKIQLEGLKLPKPQVVLQKKKTRVKIAKKVEIAFKLYNLRGPKLPTSHKAFFPAQQTQLQLVCRPIPPTLQNHSTP